MFRSLFGSFVRSYGRAQGRRAAGLTRWLAIPLLIVAGLLGLYELASGGELAHLVPTVPLVQLLTP